MEENTNFNDCSSQRKQRLRTGINSSFKTAEKLLQNQVFGISFNKKNSATKTSDFYSKNNNEYLPKQKKEDVFRIQKENNRLKTKITTIRSSFSVKKWTSEYQKTRNYMNFLSKTSASKTTRCKSRQESHRPLIDCLSTYLVNL